MRAPAIVPAVLAALTVLAGCAFPAAPPAPAQAVADAPVTAYPPASDLLVAGDGEAATLARIDHELAALEPLIREAERQSNRDARVRFEYGWLRADLGRMRQGIKAHLEAPRREPRRVEPLRGDYRT